MSWSNDVVLEFLDHYRREQLLWDPKHPHHRNRTEVLEAWLRIQRSMTINCSVTDLKRKKESLMTSFRMHWNKKKRSQDSYHTTWFAYPLMESFLGGKYECDSTQMEQEFFVNTALTAAPTLPDHNAPRNPGMAERTSSGSRQTRQSLLSPRKPYTHVILATKSIYTAINTFMEIMLLRKNKISSRTHKYGWDGPHETQLIVSIKNSASPCGLVKYDTTDMVTPRESRLRHIRGGSSVLKHVDNLNM